MSAPDAGLVVSVNVGQAGWVRVKNQELLERTAIDKRPVAGRVRVEGELVAGDTQVDREAHGGPDQAVYAYATEDYEWWEGELRVGLRPGLFGENLTTRGIDVSGAELGERWQVGTSLLEVRGIREPCRVFAGFMLAQVGVPDIVPRFRAAARPGAYLGIVEPGDIGAGDEVVVLSRPGHGVTLTMVAQARHHRRDLVPELLQAPQLPPRLKTWALAQMD